ncbi:MAG: CocE/NonD family hydrolase C-terminal non-catalytic domain-containing protein, partial [Actinomycetota bacterium]
VEVSLTEILPDGSEVYVQSGWLRASHRALDATSTELRPTHTHLVDDAAPLNPPGEFDEVRVELFPFAHVFRAGSQLRLTIDAPGGDRAVWELVTIADGEEVTIGTGGAIASSVVLPVIPGVDAPADAPACGSLRGQPCIPG